MSSIKDNIGTFTVIEGEARGADKLARVVAEELNLPVDQYPANWELYGRAAGPIRNSEMLIEGKADAVVAFHSDLPRSKGTGNMVRQALKAGRPVLTSEDGPLALAEFILQLKKIQRDKKGEVQ
jgi:hypothetical protein